MKKLTGSVYFFAFFFSALFFLSVLPDATACDIAVVSGKITKDGRPIIWKNRDHSANWKQELRYYDATDADIGGSIRIIDRTTADLLQVSDTIVPEIMSGGANESGFAILNTTVYEYNIIHEYISNANVYLMETALETCKTVSDFDDLILNFHNSLKNIGKIICGNFVVLDGEGGAALYEIYSGTGLLSYIQPLQYLKFDANNEETAPYGFVNRTNSHTWIERTNDDHREERGYFILEQLSDAGSVTVEDILMTLAKDLYFEDDSGYTLAPPGDDPLNFDTSSCISRYQTNFAIAIEGVKDGENAKYTTLWCNMGEPSVGVSTPHFPFAGKVTPYAWAESGMETDNPVDDTPTCALNQAINDCELTMYSNNWAFLVSMDNTMDYTVFLGVQEWSLPLEKTVIRGTQKVLDKYRNGNLPSGDSLEDALYNLSHYASRFVYNNYSNQSSTYQSWSFHNVTSSDIGLTDDDDSTDTDDDSSTAITGNLSSFMTWLLNDYAPQN